jgi:hypothetical protein
VEGRNKSTSSLPHPQPTSLTTHRCHDNHTVSWHGNNLTWQDGNWNKSGYPSVRSPISTRYVRQRSSDSRYRLHQKRIEQGQRAYLDYTHCEPDHDCVREFCTSSSPLQIGLKACSSTDVFQIPATVASRGSNHWIGSCTIGADDGRSGGKAVVDLDTKVYGSEYYSACSSGSSLTSRQLIICLLSMPRSSQESLPGIRLLPLSL